MASKIFKLKEAGLAHTAIAERVAAHLNAMGFGCEDLEDLVYEVASTISMGLKEELGTSTAQRIASVEFMAADEVNQHSMVDQLIILRQHHGTEEAWRNVLTAQLRIDLPLHWFEAPAVS